MPPTPNASMRCPEGYLAEVLDAVPARLRHDSPLTTTAIFLAPALDQNVFFSETILPLFAPRAHISTEPASWTPASAPEARAIVVDRRLWKSTQDVVKTALGIRLPRAEIIPVWDLSLFQFLLRADGEWDSPSNREVLAEEISYALVGVIVERGVDEMEPAAEESKSQESWAGFARAPLVAARHRHNEEDAEEPKRENVLLTAGEDRNRVVVELAGRWLNGNGGAPQWRVKAG